MENTERKYLLLGLKVVGEFGAIIAVPVVILSLLGKWLDGRFGTRPVFVIAGFALAALVSGISIVRKAKEYGARYMKIEAEEKALKERNAKK